MGDLLLQTIGVTIRIETVLEKDLWAVMIDPTQLELVILNLAINSRDAMPHGGRLTVATKNIRVSDRPRPAGLAPREYVAISVSDTGSGMTQEVAAKAFLITRYSQPSSHGTKQEHMAVSAGLNDGAQQGAISKGAQRGPVCCALRNRGSVPGGGDALALAIRLCLPGLRRGASQLRQDPGAIPV
jgi:hypothetical protein